MQRARDDRSLLLDALERLLLDLRSQSHSAAFLARVNKRDAPDYYDVIKNPMDLGLMLKNVKSGKYRTKEAFKKDLDLIWDNCLLYNTEPSHPLRASANLMRKRSHDLLSYIQDSNDVKSALSEWVATHTSLTPAEAKALQKGELPVSSIKPSTTTAHPETTPAATTLSSRAAEKQPVKGEAAGTTSSEQQSFENSRALLPASGSRLAQVSVETRRRGERDDWALSAALGENWDQSWPGSVHKLGESSRSVHTSQPIFEAHDEEKEVDELVCGLASGRMPDLLTGPETGSKSHPAEWSTAGSRVDLVLPKLRSSESFVETKRGASTHRPTKRKRRVNAVAATEASDAPPSSNVHRRGVDIMKSNVSTLKRMKRLKDKFDILESCLENEIPLPGSLLVDTDDEDDGANYASTAGAHNDDSRREIWSSYRNADPSMSESQVAEANLSDDARLTQPYAHLSLGEARARLAARIGLVIGNVGFEAAHTRPTDILNSVAEEFLLSLGRTLRLYTDRCGSSMTKEELLLHTLHSTSNMQAEDLDRYVSEHTFRYQNRLEDLRRKLEASWKERIAVGEERLITEEDARFFGEESEDLVAGNLPSALDDDFFGFKAMGLDQELGTANLQVPLRLLQRRGMANRRAGEAGLGSRKEEPKDPFPPPRPFIRLCEAAIPVQIGLLRPYYQDLLHRRGHHGRSSGTAGASSSTAEDRKDTNDADDEGAEDEYDENDEDVFALSDEEQERTSRYKVPPTGKMPRRDFWSNKPPAATSVESKRATTNGGSAARASGSAGPGAANGTSSKGAAGGAGAGTAGQGKGRKKGKKD